MQKRRTGIHYRVLIINGAVRKGGNTDILVKSFIDGAKAAGIQVRQIGLRKCVISDCGGCYQCKDRGICSIDDDMVKIREQIKKADVLVFASPLYFCGVTGLMRLFLDRLYFFYHKENNPEIAGKRVMILVPLGEKKAGFETSIVEEFFRRYLRALNLVPLDILYFPGLMGKDAIKDHPEMVERAYYLGRSIQILLRKLDISSELDMLKLQFGVPKKKARRETA